MDGDSIVYDEVIMSVDLTSDEVDLLAELLSCHLDQCVSVGEEITVKELLKKLKN